MPSEAEHGFESVDMGSASEYEEENLFGEEAEGLEDSFQFDAEQSSEGDTERNYVVNHEMIRPVELKSRQRRTMETSYHSDGSNDLETSQQIEQLKLENVPAEVEKEKMQKCSTSQRVKQMYTTSDWWSLWISLLSFVLAIALVFSVQYEQGTARAKYVIPQPMRWRTNPFEAWDIYAFVGTILLLPFLCSLYLLSLQSMGKLETNTASKYAKGFALMSVIATLAFWLGRNRWCYLHGLGYAIFSILFGMIIANSPLAAGERLSSVKLVAKDGEFFIKCSLALLAVEFSVLGEVGLPAIGVAWIGSPLALVFGYLVGTRLFKMDKGLAILVATGSSWCGASAISAIGSVIEAPCEQISLSISVVAFFTVIFTFAQPYLAIGVGMDHLVAGAWIGGSVDQTGNVVAAAAIISEEATEVAAVVKIILNSGLGILATVVAFWWQTRHQANIQTGTAGRNKKGFSWLFLWDKFPKFILGYIFCSAVLSITLPRIQGTPEADAFQRAVISMNTWWFAIAFVGIGIGTNIKVMWHSAVKSGIIQLYLISNFVDIGISLGLAYLLF